MRASYYISVCLFGSASIVSGTMNEKPKKTIAGIIVIDTPIVRDAQAYALLHTDRISYNHVMRSWLLGALMISENSTLASTIDLEVVALGTILHDLGLDDSPKSPITSPDRRFEVDGAIAARNFISSHADGKNWEEKRVQQVWDGI